jgi:predicted membrane protein DUF2254
LGFAQASARHLSQPAQESLSRGSKFRSDKHLSPWWRPQRDRSNLVLERAETLRHRQGESPPRAKPTLAPFDGGRPVGEPPLSRHNLPDSDAGRLRSRCEHVHGDEIRDEAGEPRLVFRTPNWEGFVQLTCTEIRHCSASSVEIMRRLRSMLENLMQTLPPHRHAELRQQLDLLDRVIDGQYAFPDDRTIARIADPQGLGGALGVQPAPEAPTAEGEGRDT